MDSEMLQEMLMETSVTFQDVCGYSDVKDCLNAYTYDLNQASVRGKQLPSPILLFGHPGVGKTRLLQAAASEANSKLLVFSPYMMTGRLFPKSFTESIKAVFTVARDNSPCILCFEDVSVWSNERNRGEAGEEFVTQLLAQYQEASLDKNEVALVMTSVNPWHLKLSSINKFKPVHVDLPPQETRIDLMKLCLKDISYDFGDEVFSVLAERTSGFTGADISCLVKDASMEAIRKITKATFFKKILVPEQKKDREKKGEKSCMKDQKFEGKAASSVCESETRSVRGELAATAAAEERARLIDSEHPRSEILTEKFVPCQETDEGAIQSAGGGAQTCDRKVSADLRVDLLATEPPTHFLPQSHWKVNSL
ncbi:vacuolar protein sorting-associated protein 4a [Plakobranchus ocellatus]|uniref:Vacuolar protein sorting-associated protein 4a n=1 Tax=Plakobranchus ocellatus TaxID=259542 RepID=A0AAV4E3F3_9GAST|nr:vacuolar protein sorting-associated protein 4a [Plakobranchus ocellatus]